MILEERPETIICIGDFADLESCSNHSERGSATHKAAPSLADDALACRTAQQMMFEPVIEWNARERRTKHRQYRPHLIFIEGNHEARYARWAEANPSQASVIDFRHIMGYDQYWDEIHRYKDWVTVDGIDYTHIPHNVMGRPMGGVNLCRTVALQSQRHSIFGHSHSMNVANAPLLGSTNASRMALSGPAFMSEGHIEPYARGNQTGWIYGLLRVYPQANGRPFGFDYVSMSQLEEMYGDQNES
jgi:hypothetical protein